MRQHRIANIDEARQAYVKSATGYALSKNNKLSAPKVKTSSENLLVNVQNLQTQLRVVQQHMIAHDMIDVNTIVVPVDLDNVPDLEISTYNVFEDYTRLHHSHVANSNRWYQAW